MEDTLKNNQNDKSSEARISYTDFVKVKLRTAKVLLAERIEGSTKLLRLEIDTDGGRRQIVAGLGEHYSPEQLIGKTIIVVANLEPRILKGFESNGMLLAADCSSRPILLTTDGEVDPGSIIK